MIKMVKQNLDDIDFRIAYELKNDCRISYKQLGGAISLSPSLVYERTKKMEEKNVILSYNAKVDWGKFGYSIHAFILLKDDRFIGDVPYFLKDRDEVFNLYMVSGEYDYMLEVYIANKDDLGNFMDYLYRTVGRTYTLLILREIYEVPEKP
ncbi:Lrp/AsnC family transcriptional regulator [Synergistes jonesii]|uniref:HTH asnC-type domain-containing protein n=1 Tax=Synergistes jonesii TaxID=2754 RepID=A0A073ISX8_9BACT|nr:Lrp/AsnC family transcriptional regulator [Synergistes jonesii]KEJ92665.1 hypothetical protein EH55_02595 [Synergistes jonesii]OFB63573.1 hypothetical protein JS73_04990 [Synergistes jonesii]OFB63857.1 hypothetical protein JS72_06195 [Synergistes jonesii]OFB64388.1 hypothetical protein JS79_05540 [Synergistes jonesii]OFB68023.1 hypothetical protein JS78_05005 [Synergistes jonesii]